MARPINVEKLKSDLALAKEQVKALKVVLRDVKKQHREEMKKLNETHKKAVSKAKTQKQTKKVVKPAKKSVKKHVKKAVQKPKKTTKK